MNGEYSFIIGSEVGSFANIPAGLAGRKHQRLPSSLVIESASTSAAEPRLLVSGRGTSDERERLIASDP